MDRSSPPPRRGAAAPADRWRGAPLGRGWLVPGRGWLGPVLLCAVVGLAACGGDATSPTIVESPFDAASTTTTSIDIQTAQVASAPTVAPAALSSDAAVLPTTSTPAAKGLATPEAASQNLWDAWRDDDRERALLFASTSAVDALFATRWRPDARNEGCGTVGGVHRCVYLFTENSRNVARLVIIDGSDQLGYRATRVQALGDLPSTKRLDGALSDTPSADGASESADPAIDVPVGIPVPGDVTALQSAPTVPGAPAAAVPSSGSGSAGSSGRSTTRRRVTTKAAATAPSGADGGGDGGGSSGGASGGGAGDAPSPAPAPEPAPAPAPGPVQAGHTVDTVAPG